MNDHNEFETIQRLLDARSPTERLPEAVEGLAPAIERGHHIALVASEGARLCQLYSAAAIHDLGDGDAARALVLVSTPDRARRLARSIERIGNSIGWETVLWTPERAEAGVPIGSRAVVVATPARLLADVRSGDVGLGDLRLLVLDDVKALEDAWPAVEALLQAGGSDLRRIAATHERDATFDELVIRLLPRARRWPDELFRADSGETPAKTEAPLRFAAAPSYEARLRRLVRLLHYWAGEPDLETATVWCDSTISTTSVEAALAIEGFAIASDTEEDGIRVAHFGQSGAPPPGAPGISFGLPWSAGEMEAALGPAKPRAAVVEPRHVRQLELLGKRVGWPVRALPDPGAEFGGEVEAFRDGVREAIGSRDLAGATLLIEPLIEEHGYHRVAAALTSLLRDTRPVPLETEGTRAAPTAPPAPPSEAVRAARPTWSRIFVNIGRQDGAAPGDFVGAITGETGAVGGQIGRIDIRQRFALIDVDSMVVDDVVRGLTGKQIKGRDVVVRLDRDT